MTRFLIQCERDRPEVVEVLVYGSLRAMRRALARRNPLLGVPEHHSWADTAAVCLAVRTYHRGELTPLVGQVYISRRTLEGEEGLAHEVVAHEMTHAAMTHLMRRGERDVRLVLQSRRGGAREGDPEERLAECVGWMVGQFWTEWLSRRGR